MNKHKQKTPRWASIKEKAAKGLSFYEEFYMSGWRKSALKEIRAQDDLFLMFLFSEEMGIPNPVIWYMLEIYPFLLEYMHDWHKRMGMERCPFHSMKCC